MNSFTTDVSYVPGGNARDINDDFIPKRQIGQVSLSEQFSPLIGIDITWKNKNDKSSGSKSAIDRGGRSSGGNFTTRIEYKRDRNISLTLAGIQVTEVKVMNLHLVLAIACLTLSFRLDCLRVCSRVRQTT